MLHREQQFHFDNGRRITNEQLLSLLLLWVLMVFSKQSYRCVATMYKLQLFLLVLLVSNNLLI